MRATSIEDQNAFAPMLCFAQGSRGRWSKHAWLDYDWSRSKRAWSNVHSIHSYWKSKRMLATYMRRMRNNNLEIRIAVSFCRPQWRYLILIQFYSFLRPWNRVKFWTYLDWAYLIPLGGPFISLSAILADPFFLLLDFGVLITCCACAAVRFVQRAQGPK